MLTQGPTRDPNNKLNISSLGTFPDPLDCLIYASNIMIIVFLLHMTGHGKVGGGGGGGSFMLGFGWGAGGGYHKFSIALFCFCVVVICFLMAGTG